MSAEFWLPVSIEAYASKHVVSNLGRVKNVLRDSVLTPMRTGSKRPGAQRSKVRFSTAPRLDFDVAHLVLTAFVCPRPEGMVAMHMDDDSSNNEVANLRWGTLQDNSVDCAKKMRSPRQKLHPSVMLEIRSRRERGETGAALAREHGISQQRVCDIFKGRDMSCAVK